MGLLTFINRGILPTERQVQDKDWGEKNNTAFVEPRIADMFGNITSIHEKRWIIMINDVERGINDTYRLAEIIGRFKSYGVKGLPIKITFLLCISFADVEKTLKLYENKINVVRLLEMFFDDPRIITLRINFPLPSFEARERYVAETLLTLSEIKKIYPHEKLLRTKTSWKELDPENALLTDEKSWDFILYLLYEERPRMVDRIGEEFGASMCIFKNNRRIRYSDLLTLAYIKVKYPFLIDFFNKTIGAILPSIGFTYADAVKEDGETLINWITRVTEHPFMNTIKEKGKKKEKAKEEKRIEQLIAAVAFSYYTLPNPPIITYEGTSSLPENLYNYLHFTPG